MDTGPNKPNTFDWIINRTQDGFKQISPREIIHLLDESRKAELKKTEAGDYTKSKNPIISPISLKEALNHVSSTRLVSVLYAEYPALKPYIEAFRGGKTRYGAPFLSELWELDNELTEEMIKSLLEAGFFEKRIKNGNDYWIPFLYRGALQLTQGTAEDL